MIGDREVISGCWCVRPLWGRFSTFPVSRVQKTSLLGLCRGEERSLKVRFHCTFNKASTMLALCASIRDPAKTTLSPPPRRSTHLSVVSVGAPRRLNQTKPQKHITYTRYFLRVNLEI